MELKDTNSSHYIDCFSERYGFPTIATEGSVRVTADMTLQTRMIGFFVTFNLTPEEPVNTFTINERSNKS